MATSSTSALVAEKLRLRYKKLCSNLGVAAISKSERCSADNKQGVKCKRVTGLRYSGAMAVLGRLGRAGLAALARRGAASTSSAPVELPWCRTSSCAYSAALPQLEEGA